MPRHCLALGIALPAGGPPGVTTLLILGLCCAWLVVWLFQTMERLVGSFGAIVTGGPAAIGARPLALYRLHTRSAGAAKPPGLNMPHTPGRMLER
jgi:hypothetical protein